MADVAEGWSKYRVVGTIGSSATGTVFLCDDTAGGRQVAVKELGPSLTLEPGFLPRFRGEAQLMARLESPNCIRVFDFFEQDGRAFLVTEHVPGATLRAVMTASGRLTPEQSLGVLRGVISGLGFAHALGIVHRDIKPENVLVDGGGVSRLSDFGQALPSGTPGYMSPEQVRGAAADHRSDIYSAGVMLFELLTGNLPYLAHEPVSVMRMQVEAPVPDPRGIAPAIPEPVAQLVMQAMSKDPAARPRAPEFFRALEAAAVAGCGADWARRSSIKRLAAPLAGATAALGAIPAAASAAGAVLSTAPASTPQPAAPVARVGRARDRQAGADSPAARVDRRHPRHPDDPGRRRVWRNPCGAARSPRPGRLRALREAAGQQ